MSKFDTSKIPQYLKEHTQWLLWKLEQRKGKATKVPYQVNGARAKSNDPSTWSNFDTCVQAFESARFDGMGFVFAEGDGLTGVDLDHCYDVDGQLEPWAQEILDQCSGAYTEKSPSSTGVHIIGFGRPLKTGSKKWKKDGTDEDQGIEVYDFSSPRYFTVSGNSLNGSDLGNCQQGLDWLYQHYLADQHAEPKQARDRHGELDAEIVRKALTFIPADDYADWIKIGMSLKASGLNLEVWDNWSSRSSKYEPGVCAGKWKTFNGTRVGIGTVFYHAQKHGFEFSAQGARPGKPEHITETPAWEEDRPLYRELSPAENFPMDALGDLLESAVRKCREVIQAPDSISAYSFLAALNLAVQPHADVVIDGRFMPVSEYFVEAAESGDRKSATDSVALSPHEDWQRLRLSNYEANPDGQLKPMLICSEPTYEGLIKQLATGYPSMGLYSNEGGRFLGGHAMNKDNMLKTAAGLSGLWDTGKFDRVRAADGASAHYGRRLSMHLMIQPDLAPLLFGNRLLVGQGLISRILPAAPLRTDKKYMEVDLSQDPAIVTYSSRITELLNLPLPIKKDTPNTLEPFHLQLSPKAKSAYMKFHDAIQSKLGDGKQLASIRGFGNKAHDHAARIAATVARGSDVQVRIVSLEDFERGVIVATFAMSELLRIIDASNVSSSLLDAQRLLDWLLVRGQRYFCLREVYQRGPGSVRNASKARWLLDILQEHGKVRPTRERVEYGDQLSPAWEVRAFAGGQR